MAYYDYTESGIKVLRLHGITDGSCDCDNQDCKAVGKHPFATNWQNTPLWSEEALDNMDAVGWLDSFGVLLENMLVIDIDPRNGGFDGYKQLCEDTGIDFEKESGFVVETGGNGKHIYFSNKDALALRTHHDLYIGIDFKSSGFVVGSGSLHASGQHYETDKGDPSKLTAVPDKLIKLLEKKSFHRGIVNGEHIDISDSQLKAMLSFITADDYETMVTLGMAIHHTTGGAGFELWNEWCEKSDKYDGIDTKQRKWHGFGKSANPVTLGTLYHLAEEGGYIQPVTFEMPQSEILPTQVKQEPINQRERTKPKIRKDKASELDKPAYPMDVSNIDINAPMGLVGRLTKHLNDNSRRKREIISVMGALSTVGNLAGLRFTDSTKTSTNLFWFGIADSGTGKDGVIAQCIEIYQRLGCGGAMHGMIKSEQEIYRNLIEHQASFYVIDEFGKFLQKIESASKKGGASYLESIPALWMSAYSKTEKTLPISGDMTRDISEMLAKRIVNLTKTIDENYPAMMQREGEDPQQLANRKDTRKLEDTAKLNKLKHQLDNIGAGIEKPYLSLTGFSTHIGFNEFFTESTIKDGLLGRAIIFKENDSAPRTNRDFKDEELPTDIFMALADIYSNRFDIKSKNARVEMHGDKVKIPDDAEAAHLIDELSYYFDDLAEWYQHNNGFEALALRGLEAVKKVSLILAIPERLRRKEHVQYAFKLIMQDIETKIEMVRDNLGSESKDNSVLVSALESRILTACTGTEMSTSVIVQRVKNKTFTKEIIHKMLDKLKNSGRIEEKEVKNPRSGVVSLKYIKIH